jgi:hypothetical protein
MVNSFIENDKKHFIYKHGHDLSIHVVAPKGAVCLFVCCLLA